MKHFISVLIILIMVICVIPAAIPSSTVQAVEDLTESAETRTYLYGTPYPNARSCALTYGGGDWTDPIVDYFTEIGVLEIMEEKLVYRVEVHGSGCLAPATLTVNGITKGASVFHDQPPYGEETIAFDIAPSDNITMYTGIHTGSDNHGFLVSWVKTYLADIVSMDVKPMSWPNPLNVNDKGKLPVAILGTADFDVTQIDPATVLLEGVAPLRWASEDVGRAGDPLAGPDGFTDLSLKFDAQAIVAVLGPVNDGDVVVLGLTGNLKPELGGTSIVGEDVVIIIKKK